MKAEELDRLFDEVKEDILQYFDLSRARQPGLEQKRVNVDFPSWVVNKLDKESVIWVSPVSRSSSAGLQSG